MVVSVLPNSADVMPGPRLHVLVTGVGGSVGQAVAQELLRRGAVVHGAEQYPITVAGAATWQLPSVHDSAYLPALTRLVTRLDVSLVVPTVLAELPVLAAGRAAFGPDVEVLIAGAGPVAMARDRLLTAFQLRSRGVAVPHFATPSAFADTASALRAIGPLVVRRRTTDSNRPAFRVSRAADLDWSQLSDDHLVQRYLPGEEFLPMVYRPGAKGVQQRVSVLHRRPGTTEADGSGEIGTVSGAEDVERVSLAAVRALGLSGPANLVIRRAAGQAPAVVDVSARFGQHLAAAPEMLDSALAAHEVFTVGRQSA